jgi:hypothetical protein
MARTLVFFIVFWLLGVVPPGAQNLHFAGRFLAEDLLTTRVSVPSCNRRWQCVVVHCTAALSLLKQEVSRMIRYAFLSSLYVVSLLALTLAYSFVPT